MVVERVVRECRDWRSSLRKVISVIVLQMQSKNRRRSLRAKATYPSPLLLPSLIRSTTPHFSLLALSSSSLLTCATAL